MSRLVDGISRGTDSIFMFPTVCCRRSREDSWTIGTEIFIIIRFCLETSIHDLDSRQRGGIACTKHTAAYRAVGERGGDSSVNLSKAAAAIEVTSDGATCQIGSDVMGGCQ